MASFKTTRFKLFLAYTFCLCIIEPAFKRQEDSQAPRRQVAPHFAQALLYHQFQLAPAPLLSRYNRQPHQNISNASSPPTSSSDSPYYIDSTQSQNNYQATQENYRENRNHQRQSQTSFLTSRDLSNDELAEDPYGCPIECHCNKIAQIADCSNRNLTRVPASFPKDIKRIRLERNNITEIGPYVFQGLKRLQRIDLSNNNLYKIDPLAFSGGLQTLNSLILYSNKLEHLPVGLFNELSQLQLLLLNANSLQTIHKDLFQALANLNLLSLYDNNIVTLPSGAFDGLKNIKTIHLGKNPLNCDCNLRWLLEYLESNPVETSEARCEAPMRAQGRKLSQLSRNEFKCQDPQPNRAATNQQLPFAQQQAANNADQSSCPAGCICNGSTVDCSRASPPSSETRSGGGTYELPDVPDDVPVYVARVHINDNRIKRIRQTGLFRRLANSQKLDLGNNKIIDIEDNAINGQFSNGQKPERVVFVLLENQHCEATTAPPTASQPGEVQTKSNRPINRQQQVPPEDPCATAPKVNDPEFDSACYNGGLCRPTRNSHLANYSCVCPAGFAGPLCEINIDDCVDHQCQNGAMCVDGINSYKCICRDPTTAGEFCEQINSMGSSNYAASSANSIAPLALPIIAAGGASLLNGAPAPGPSYDISAPATVGSTAGPPLIQPQQIIARSANNFGPSDDLASNLLAPPSSLLASSSSATKDQSECHRVTQKNYIDDGNGCQSVRMLKIRECAGSCGGGGGGGGQGAGSGCCLPTQVKRRRIRMQCSDGATYIKTVDLIKKCGCSSDSGCPIFPSPPQPARVPPALPTKGNDENSKGGLLKYGSHQKPPRTQSRQSLSAYNVTQDDQLFQVTRLDAVD